MNKNVIKRTIASNSTLMPSTINQNSSNFISNSNLYQNNPNFSSFSKLENLEEDSDFFSPLTVNNNRPGRIIHQSTEHSIDRKGNRVIKVKIIRELDSYTINDIYKNKRIKIITKTNSQKNYQNLNLNIYNKYNQYNSKTYRRINKQKFLNSPAMIEISPNYNEIISPVGYINNNNYSSGSENEDNHMRSFDDRNKYNLDKIKKIKKINYELEDPESFDYLQKKEIKRINKGRNLSRKNKDGKNIKKVKISQIILNKSEYYDNSNQKLINKSYLSDFKSPDRDLTNQNKFRKITENMLSSKGPTNDDKKVTTIIKDKFELELNNKSKKHIKIYKNRIKKNNFSQIEAAKIIQSWWRNNNKLREKEVYDITVKNAIRLQSFIRGYLIRKKVLRFITLAIYYQTFCEKIQNVFYSKIKRRLFNFLKRNKKRKIKKSGNNMIKNISNNNSRSFISSIGNQSPKTYQSPLTFINNSSNNKIKYNNYKYIIKNNNNNYNRIYLSKYNTIKSNIIENSKTVTTTRRIITTNIQKSKNKRKNYNNKNEIISGGTLSIIKLPNRRMNNSESEDIFSLIKEEQKKKILYFNNNNISQNERKRKSSSNLIKEKIIIREELKPETAEDGNERQTFDMKISKNLNMKIPSSFRTKRVTKEEMKELEIIKKREKEKNKKILIYKKNYETIKNKNKLDTMKHAIKIVEYHKKIILKKFFDKFKNNYKEKSDKNYEIEIANDIQIKQNSKEKNKLLKNGFNQLLITENRSVSFNPEIKNNKKENIIIANDKLNIISKIKKEEFGSQIGQWQTKMVKDIKNDIHIIQSKPELIETGIQYKTLENKITKSKLNIISKTIKEEPKKWETIISKENNDINIINSKPEKKEEGSQYSNIKNTINKNDEIKIINKKPKLVDDGIQHETPNNQITKSKFDIISKIQKNDECSQVDNLIINNSRNKISTTNNQINIKPIKPQKVDECTQYVKIENIIGKTKEYKIIQQKKNLTETGIQPNKIENKISKTKLSIISNISPYKKGKILINKWNPVISRPNSVINILSSKPKKLKNNNSINKIQDINIIHKRPKLVNEEIQYEINNNHIDKRKLKIAIISSKIKPQYRDSFTQYEEENKNVIDKGINTIMEEKNEKKEVKLRTVKRSIHKMEIPLLKKIWLRKAFKTFISNCKRPAYHLVIKKELLRMYLLKWRFIKGYGADMYGNIYDRNGKILYKTEGKFVDEEIQQDFNVENKEESTQYIPIENVISTLKQMEIKGICKNKKEIAVGNDLILEENIQRSELNLKGNKKEKQKNKIDKNSIILEITHKDKIFKDEGTIIDSPLIENKISNSQRINISREEYNLKNKKNLYIKTLLTQMIYKKTINEKLILSNSLRHWLKQILLISQKSIKDKEIQKKKFIKIFKNEQFYLLDKIKKEEIGTQIEEKENKIENIEKINIINLIKKKDSQTCIDIPIKFEKINPQNQIDISYKYYKKRPLLRIKKENNVNIISEYYINIEEMKQANKKRINEILFKFINSRTIQNCLLKKFFNLWRRNVKCLSLNEYAKIITDFCRNNLNKTNNYKKWKKISEKLIIKERIQIIKKIKTENKRKNKIFNLIRITRINSIQAKRRYLHYILFSWLAFTKNISRKKEHIKELYENMLKNYINITDDVFGNNKKSPSVQDSLYEVMDSDKYNIKNGNKANDVPLAEVYYKNKKETQKITTKITYINNNNYINKKFMIPTGYKERTNINEDKKVIKIRDNERLHSKGRGRKYRTRAEKEILDKFRKFSGDKENLNMNLKENINNSMRLDDDKDFKEVENNNQSNSFFI